MVPRNRLCGGVERVALSDMTVSDMSASAILRRNELLVSLPLGSASGDVWEARGMVNSNASDHRRGRLVGTRAPGFVLCPARSGSTLLRLLLNGHPEIACPPETNLVEIFAKIGFTVASTSNTKGDAKATQIASDQATALCRDVAQQTLGAYAESRGKTMWVDKSLASVLYADVLAKVYPEGRFICLYRQCPDTVASLNEASVWS